MTSEACSVPKEKIKIMSEDTSKNQMSLRLHELQQSSKTVYKECQYCKELFDDFSRGYNYSAHVKSCKIYSKLMKKSDNSYDCLICSFESKNPELKTARKDTKRHIGRMHHNELNSVKELPDDHNSENFKSDLHENNFPAPLVNHASIDAKKEDRIQKHSNSMKTKSKCKSCEEIVPLFRLSIHYKACKLYGRYVHKSSEYFECKLCTEKRADRWRLYAHIRKKHQRILPKNFMYSNKVLGKQIEGTKEEQAITQNDQTYSNEENKENDSVHDIMEHSVLEQI